MFRSNPGRVGARACPFCRLQRLGWANPRRRSHLGHGPMDGARQHPPLVPGFGPIRPPLACRGDCLARMDRQGPRPPWHQHGPTTTPTARCFWTPWSGWTAIGRWCLATPPRAASRCWPPTTEASIGIACHANRFPTRRKGKRPLQHPTATLACHGDTVWIFTGGLTSRCLRSLDAGASWASIDLPVTQGSSMTGVFSATFRNARQGWAMGGNWEVPEDNEGNLAATTDGGTTWENHGRWTRPWIPVVHRAPSHTNRSLGGHRIRGLGRESGRRSFLGTSFGQQPLRGALFTGRPYLVVGRCQAVDAHGLATAVTWMPTQTNFTDLPKTWDNLRHGHHVHQGLPSAERSTQDVRQQVPRVGVHLEAVFWLGGEPRQVLQNDAEHLGEVLWAHVFRQLGSQENHLQRLSSTIPPPRASARPRFSMHPGLHSPNRTRP